MTRFQSDRSGSLHFLGLVVRRGVGAGCFSIRVVMSTGLRARFFCWQLDHHVGQMVEMMADMMADMKCGKSSGNQGFLTPTRPTWPT